MNYYYINCTTIEEAKNVYRNLCKLYHPDNSETGNADIFRVVVDQFQEIAQRLMYGAYHAYASEHGYSTDRAENTSFVFADILSKIVDYDIDIEIIGYWIYAFNAYEYRAELKSLGFWFSKKHRAWIFSGSAKKRIRTRYTTNDNRLMHGSQRIREKSEKERLTV